MIEKKPFTFNPSKPPAQSNRRFEVRISDRNTGMVYAMDFVMPTSVFVDGGPSLRKKFQDGFKRLLDALLRGGSLPVVSAEVVDAPDSETKEP